MQSEITKLLFQVGVSDAKMNRLLEEIATLNFRLDNPTQSQIKHSHHLHKGVWVLKKLCQRKYLSLKRKIAAGKK